MELLEQGLIDNAATVGDHMKARMSELPRRFRTSAMCAGWD